jgi:hypothetical protein
MLTRAPVRSSPSLVTASVWGMSVTENAGPPPVHGEADAVDGDEPLGAR